MTSFDTMSRRFPSQSLPFTWKDIDSTTGIRYQKMRQGVGPRTKSWPGVASTRRIIIESGVILTALNAVEGSVWSTQTFGSRYQDAASIMHQEMLSREIYRTNLIHKKYKQHITLSEQTELDELQRDAAQKLKLQMADKISYLKRSLVE